VTADHDNVTAVLLEEFPKKFKGEMVGGV